MPWKNLSILSSCRPQIVSNTKYLGRKISTGKKSSQPNPNPLETTDFRQRYETILQENAMQLWSKLGQQNFSI